MTGINTYPWESTTYRYDYGIFTIQVNKVTAVIRASDIMRAEMRNDEDGPRKGHHIEIFFESSSRVFSFPSIATCEIVFDEIIRAMIDAEAAMQ